jgi:hypothetical protein
VVWRTNCKGTLSGIDGSQYVGEFRDNKKNGQGTFTWPDGSKYVGEYKGGMRNGHGELTFANGDRYGGEFKDEMLNGKGTYVWADSGRSQSGTWKNSKIVSLNPGIPIEIDGGTFIVPATINTT